MGEEERGVVDAGDDGLEQLALTRWKPNCSGPSVAMAMMVTR